jgi:hypothetical protein
MLEGNRPPHRASKTSSLMAIAEDEETEENVECRCKLVSSIHGDSDDEQEILATIVNMTDTPYVPPPLSDDDAEDGDAARDTSKETDDAPRESKGSAMSRGSGAVSIGVDDIYDTSAQTTDFDFSVDDLQVEQELAEEEGEEEGTTSHISVLSSTSYCWSIGISCWLTLGIFDCCDRYP